MPLTRSKRTSGEADENRRPLKCAKGSVVKKAAKKTVRAKPQASQQPVSTAAELDVLQQHSAQRPASISCRKTESEKIRSHLKDAFSSQQGAAVHVPGQPGTGKTLTVRNVLSHLPWRELQGHPPACCLVNCMDSVSFLARICLAGLREAAAKVKPASARGMKNLPLAAANACKLPKEDNCDAMREIQRIATGASKVHKGMYVLVLDEMDQACKKTNETVAEIFALCSIPRSRLIVISIANRLDLASRVLQPTGLGHGAAPHVVPFHSYTARQLLELLEERYQGQFQQRALELIAKRISAATGDMRTALAVCNAARASKPQGEELISVSQAAEALRACSSGGSAQAQGHVSRIQALPTQQQLLLCTLAIARGAAQRSTPAPQTPSISVSSARPLHALGAAPSTPPLSNANMPMRQGSISTLLAAHRTPLSAIGGRGFGLSGVSEAKKAEFKSFPMPDDMQRITPGTVSAKAGDAGQQRREATMTLKAAFDKYKLRGHEAGIKVMDSALQLESMVDDLKSAGLLEATGKGLGRSVPRENVQLQLCVSTDDVKHALSNNRMLQPLVCQLP